MLGCLAGLVEIEDASAQREAVQDHLGARDGERRVLREVGGEAVRRCHRILGDAVDEADAEGLGGIEALGRIEDALGVGDLFRTKDDEVSRVFDHAVAVDGRQVEVDDAGVGGMVRV